MLFCIAAVCLLRGNYNECVANSDDGMRCQWKYDNCVPSSNISSNNITSQANTTSALVEVVCACECVVRVH